MPPVLLPKELLNIPAPAKLNLFLHITGRRANGYHDLQSLFVPVSLYDFLDFKLIEHPDIQLTVTDGSNGQVLSELESVDNLVVRAAQLLKKEAAKIGKDVQGVDIHLAKSIPFGAGLGGGSSDAATTLMALNRLWQLNLHSSKLSELGLTLGSDVPFFIQGTMAWVEGVGEVLTPIKLNKKCYIILKPDCFISTQKIFQHPDLTRGTQKTTFCAYQMAPNSFINDCEKVVTQMHPEVGQALKYLGAFGKASLTGTGACVFVAISEDKAVDVIKNAPCKAYICQSLQQSPVQEVLKY